MMAVKYVLVFSLLITSACQLADNRIRGYLGYFKVLALSADTSNLTISNGATPSSPATITVKNEGSETAQSIQITLSNTENFQIINNQCTSSLAPQASCTFQVLGGATTNTSTSTTIEVEDGVMLVSKAPLTLTLTSSGFLTSNASTLSHWIPNKKVRTSLIANNTLYIGGAFTLIGKASGGGLVLDPKATASGESTLAAGISLDTLPKVAGNVYASVSDGEGGWYIGGEFVAIGETPITNLAHIYSDGSLDPFFNFQMDGFIRALLFEESSKTLYIGGNFSTIDSTSVGRIAAINTSTKSVITSFTPSFNNTIRAFAIDPNLNTLFVGGEFTSPRRYLAAVNTADGTLTSFDPNNPAGGNKVYTLAYDSSQQILYAGGSFIDINGTTRKRVAAFDFSSGNNGALMAFNPDINSSVNVIYLDQSAQILYLGGGFNTINATTKRKVAGIDLSTGNLTSLSLQSIDGTSGVSALTVDTTTNTLYIGGDFTKINGSTRNSIAAINLADGSLLSFDPNLSRKVQTLAFNSTKKALYAGGSFNSMAPVSQKYFAAFDLSTNALTSLDPGVSRQVRALALDTSSNTLYVGGLFGSVGGSTRNRLAAIDLTTGNVTSFNPDINDTVSALAFDSSSKILYVGGAFTSVNGGADPRNYLAAFDTTTGNVTSFNPSPDAQVLALELDTANNTLYVAGSFNSIAANTRRKIAAFDTTTGNLNSFNPDANSSVFALKLDSASGTLYMGGYFTTLNGGTATRHYLASVNATTGAATSFNPDLDGPVVQAIVLDTANNVVYAGGTFTSVNGGSVSRNNIAAFDITTSSALSSFDPNSQGTIYTLSFESSNQMLYVGGDFSFIQTSRESYLGFISTP
ncbi:MAG: hypothetical protein D6797_03460 [Bdellovibrio sp.]|nr:MAG: hypothetical protein D6797_03460 [Bdellovibrio sp.]